MAKVKFDVSGTDPTENAGKIFEDPIPGVYKAKVQACTSGFSKGDDGKPDRSRPRLEVVYEITDGKDNGKFRGSRVWDYVVFTEASQWRLDQFLLAMGISNNKKRKGEFDTDDIVGMPVKLRIAADQGTSVAAGDYRPRVKTVLMGEDSDIEDEGDVEELEEDEVVADEEIEDEADEVEADSEGYTEDALSELKITDLGKILTDEFDVSREDMPKGKDPKIAMILDLQSSAEGEAEQEEADAEDAEDSADEDLDELARTVDDEEDEEGTAQERLEELAEENDLDPNDYETWAELAEELKGLVGGDEGTNQRAELEAMSIADLRAKAKELEIDPKGAKSAVIDRIIESLGEDPF